MASPNLQAVKLEGTPARIRKLLGDMNGRATVIIRGTKTQIFVAVPGNELGWLDKVAKDIGCKKQEIPELPAHEKAPCGALTTDLPHHALRCKSCVALREKETKKVKEVMPQNTARQTKPHNGEVHTVVKVEGLHDLTLSGLTVFMENRMNEALALAQEYDSVLKALREIPELENELSKYQGELDNHRNALRYFANLR